MDINGDPTCEHGIARHQCCFVCMESQIEVSAEVQEDLQPVWPDVLVFTLAVSRRGDSFLLNWPDIVDEYITVEVCCEDQGFKHVPKLPGVYRVSATWETSGYEGEYLEFTLKVFQKVLSYE